MGERFPLTWPTRLGSPTEKQVPPAALAPAVQTIAHRGFAEVYPENTLAAVRGAAADGAAAVEVDVRRCGSGEVVVCHDETVDRVTDGSGQVSALSLDVLASLDVLGSGEAVPTLAAVVETLPDGVALNVELKERGLAGDVLGTLANRPDGAAWWLSSFDSGALEEARAAAAAFGADDGPTRIEAALLVPPGTDDPVAAAVACDADLLHPHERDCSVDLVAAAHEAGLPVNAWTVRSETTARRLVRAGVDGLIADAPTYC